jgi:hypothetical protein
VRVGDRLPQSRLSLEAQAIKPMAFTLEQVVPWGRSFGEYERMFSLRPIDLQGTILGCADGPASFNVEARERGAQVVSVDPIYAFSAPEIRARIEAVYPQIMEQTRQSQAEFLWHQYGSVDELGRLRWGTMERFLADLETGRAAGYYRAAELPVLPFADATFDLAVCSHFLFLYATQLSEAFHVDSIIELCRVAHDVRIFPLLELGSLPSRHLPPVLSALQRLGYATQIVPVDYEFQRGGCRMLRVQRPGSGAN